MEVLMYQKPKGFCNTIEMRNIYPDDELFFVNNDITVSIEEIYHNQFAIYGHIRGTPEEEECIVLSDGRSCEETMKSLREELEKRINDTNT